MWDEIEDQKAVDIVRSEIQHSTYRAACKLRDYAYLLGSEDNISVIVVKFKWNFRTAEYLYVVQYVFLETN